MVVILKRMCITLLAILFISILVAPVNAQEQYKEKLKLNEHVIMLNLHNDELLVKELYQFTNTTSNVIDGFNVFIVPGTTGLTVSEKDEKVKKLSGETLTITEDKIYINEAIRPQQSKIYLMYYNLKLNNNKMDFINKITYPTETIAVLVPPQLKITSNQLRSMGNQQLNGIEYRVYADHDLNQSSEISYQVEKTGDTSKVSLSYSETPGLHSSSHLANWANSPLKGTNPHIWLLFLSVLVMGVVIVINLIIRQKNNIQKIEASLADKKRLHKSLLKKQQRLLAKINELDEKNTLGHIEEDVYTELRKQYKQILIKVKLRLKRLEEMG